MFVLKFLFVIFSVICCVNGAKILGVFHMSAYSHYQLGNVLLKELAAKGHEVTMISAFNQDPPIKNYRTILVSEVATFFKSFQNNIMNVKNLSFLQKTKLFNTFSYTGTELVLNNTEVQKLLKSDETFDLVIIEQFMNEAHRGFQHHYGIPCIMFSTVGANSWVNPLVGNPGPPSYVPELITGFSEHMNFFQRIGNTFLYIFGLLMQYCHRYETQNELLQKYFPTAPHLKDIIYNTSLVLLNSHVSINQPVPHVPNMIEVGGMHVKPPGKLPKDLQTYLDDAKEGVIYFSLGSNVQSKDMSTDKRDTIINVLSKLKMKVLWKWEDDELPGQPKNIKIAKWLPQQEILAHPNVKLFITHGGLLSTIETIYHGKPVLGIPFFGDQISNMNIAVQKGYGLAITYEELNEETFAAALNELLSNTKYAANALERSKLMHDQPMKPLDSAVFWVEYVIRNKGAYHFRSKALDLSWYQYLLLDVAAFAVGIVVLPLAAIFVVLKKIIARKSKAKKVVNKQKKKN